MQLKLTSTIFYLELINSLLFTLGNNVSVSSLIPLILRRGKPTFERGKSTAIANDTMNIGNPTNSSILDGTSDVVNMTNNVPTTQIGNVNNIIIKISYTFKSI